MGDGGRWEVGVQGGGGTGKRRWEVGCERGRDVKGGRWEAGGGGEL